jgi:carboxypeptidase family protein/TonB-dependent receptor-like protein
VAPASWALTKPAIHVLRGVLCGVILFAASSPLHAQGVTTATIQGTIRMADGTDPEGARVSVRSTATGFMLETDVRRGRFLLQGLEAGGPYTITVRRIGALAQRRVGVFLRLGEPLQLSVTLEPAALQLDSVVVVADDPSPLSCCHGGTATTLPDSLVHHLPSLNRDVYDFVRLVPQISTRIGFEPGGMSGGGVGFRLNSFLTNGVSERSLSGSQPPEFAGGRSLPFDAVRDYQVLLAPFDVRYGDFTGAMVNTVTRAGTNEVQGSAFGFGRSDALARGGDLAADPYERWQYGLSVSGPVVHDRVQFLVAAEFQRLEQPMVGPYVGQPAGARPAVPVSPADLSRLDIIMATYGLRAGSGGSIENRTRIGSVFARLDAALPRWNSRAVLWLNDSHARDRTFSREAAPVAFPLSSTENERRSGARTVALQLFSTLGRRGGGHNELAVSRRSLPFESVPETRQPIVQVAVPATGGGRTAVITGTPVQAQGGTVSMWDLILRDDLTLALGASHVASVGLEAEWFRIGPTGLPNAYGTWTFSSLDSLAAGQADRFVLSRDFGSAGVPISGGQFAAYAGDLWRVSDRLSLTLGVRADLLAVHGRAPYNPLVDSLFGRRTDAPIPRSVHFSPRFGFTWDPKGSGRDELRGGIGLFSGRPPLAWFHLPLRSYGVGIGTLRCGRPPGTLGPAPAFDPDPLDPPTTCAGGAGVDAPPAGDVELVDPHLKLARVLRAALAYERRLPGGFVGTVEGLVTRQLSDFTFVNLNLAGPQRTDRWGRVLYGGFDSLGVSRPALVADGLPSVIELRNVSRNHSVQLSASLAKQFEKGLAVMASYTWSRVRDVATPLRVNNPGVVNWELRALSGRHDDRTPRISLNDVPHRVVLAGTWRAPWRRWLTELSLLYVGESGSPFTYLAASDIEGLGDLNADDGLNDPIYIPRSALDPAELAFTGFVEGGDNSPPAQDARVQSQRAAFEQFVERRPCLRRQRGRIMARNSCREPWAHTTAASLRQTIPIGTQALEAQLDVFNLLNLVDGDWGLRRLVGSSPLSHEGMAPGPSGESEPVFRFVEEATEWIIDPAESAFQLQFGLRYRF